MRLSNVRMVTDACPTYWEATDETGQYVGIRYRWGTLIIFVGPDFETSQEVRRIEYGDPYAGAMDTDVMLLLTGYEAVS